MPKRSEKRDTAKAEYVSRKAKGKKVNLHDLAGELGVAYSTLRNWKTADKWDEALPPKKRGGQPGNRNSAGHKNAAGSHEGAPLGNKNAEKDGAYSAIFFDMLDEKEMGIATGAPTTSKETLLHELKIARVREHRILAKIAEYEKEREDTLHLNTLLDMRVPGGRGKEKEDGKTQDMGMYSHDTAFARIMKLQEALYKVQGRITKIADSIRAIEENEKRMELERERLDIMRMRATGAFDVSDPQADEVDE